MNIFEEKKKMYEQIIEAGCKTLVTDFNKYCSEDVECTGCYFEFDEEKLKKKEFKLVVCYKIKDK